MLMLLTALLGFIDDYKHCVEELKQNELCGIIVCGALVIIFLVAYTGCIIKGHWELLSLAAPFEIGYALYYIYFYYFNNEENN